MGLNKVRLGNLIELFEEKNKDLKYDVNSVKGIATQKCFIETKANMENVSLHGYKIVHPRMFAYVADTSRRGDKISLAFNDSNETYLVSTISTIFKVKEEKSKILLPEYLFIYFNRPEFDRYARFNSWGSARETFTWEDMCDIVLDLPDIMTQKSFVEIYYSLQKKIDLYDQEISNLQSTSNAYINKLINEAPKKPIGQYLEIIEEKNKELTYSLENVRGISTSKEFIDTKANLDNVSLHNYKIVNPKEFAYVADTSRRGDKISLAYNASQETYLVSSISTIFRVSKNSETRILSDYLFMYLKRPNFDRFARFSSWGSAREVITWEDLCRYEIPLPSLEIQKDIVAIFNEYGSRQQIKVRLEAIQKSMCPILIKGALMEA